MLDFVLTNNKELMGNVEFKVSFECSDHEMVELEILGAAMRGHKKLTTPGEQTWDFSGITQE